MDFKRYIPILQVSVPLFLLLAVANLVAAKAFGRVPAWTPETPNGITQGEILTGSRVAGIAHTLASEGNGSGAVNLVLGQSTAYTDLDCKELERQCGAPSRWFAVGGRGNSFIKMERSVSPILVSGLHPHLCVLVVDPTDLVGNPMVAKVAGRTVDAGSHNFKDGPRVWMFAVQFYANNLIQAQFDTIREGLMRKAGLPIDAIYEPEQDPNVSPIIYKSKADPKNAAFLLQNFEQFRYFSPDSYTPDGDQASAFLKLVAECRSLGAKVVVMIGPESQTMFARVPPEAMQCLNKLFAEARKSGDLPVFDMRNTQPETNMFDSLHVNLTGEKSNTENIIRQLKALYGSNYCSH